jgi:hypothetical protein
MATGAAGRVQQETMDDVQPDRVAGRIRALRGGNAGVAPGGISAGVGRSRVSRMSEQTMQWGVRDVANRGSQNSGIGWSGLHVPLSAEQEGFIRPTNQGTTMVEGVLIHILGNAVSRGPGVQARILSWKTSAMGLTRIYEWC